MALLFDSISINQMRLANRVVRSATWEGLADEKGSCTEELIAMMRRLAEGGVGLIVTGHAFVSPEGQASQRQMAVCSDEHMEGLKQMTDAVHGAYGRIALQLAHAGAMAANNLTGLISFGPMELRDKKGDVYCREMVCSEIDQTVEAFAQGAIRAKQAGFDAVQIHAAHGYLLSQFLSPYYNKRTDEYGGSVENRARFLLETIGKIREVVGPDYPILVKLNSEDNLDGGMTIMEMLKVAIMLETATVDAIELSGGTGDSIPSLGPVRRGDPETEKQEVYYSKAANLYKSNVKVPLILVGGMRSPAVVKRLVSENVTDLVALSRPLIREPNLVGRWQFGDEKRSTCISCNKCFRPALIGAGLRCVVEEKQRKAGKA